jgi:hypothetical protein
VCARPDRHALREDVMFLPVVSLCPSGLLVRGGSSGPPLCLIPGEWCAHPPGPGRGMVVLLPGVFRPFDIPSWIAPGNGPGRINFLRVKRSSLMGPRAYPGAGCARKKSPEREGEKRSKRISDTCCGGVQPGSDFFRAQVPGKRGAPFWLFHPIIRRISSDPGRGGGAGGLRGVPLSF